MADKKNTPAPQLLHTRTSKNQLRVRLPRDARDAATKGYDFGEGSGPFTDDFADASTMVRRGTMDVGSDYYDGPDLEIAFTATFKFGKPVAVKD